MTITTLTIPMYGTISALNVEALPRRSGEARGPVRRPVCVWGRDARGDLAARWSERPADDPYSRQPMLSPARAPLRRAA
jgi:hypothetical protein